MGRITRLARLTFFAGLAGAAALFEACGGSTKNERPATGGATGNPDAGVGGSVGSGGAPSGGSGGAPSGGSGGEAEGGSGGEAEGSGGGVVILDSGVEDADDLWDVIYE